ncbi:MAG: GGDEF domain-containing protein, partial [Gammaproteobacteria bacterium]|nr:GGDEF domain-containing protein [Gammaproteobacteria bacterium]
YQFIVGCIWINFVNIFLSFLGWRYSYELMVTILLFVAIVPLWFSSKRALVDPFSAFYTVAWGIHLTVVTLYVLTSLEVMNTGVYHSQVMLGSIIEMFVMTFALGYRFFLINRDKNLIEKKVDEEIKRSASWEEISYTDALTGIYNRRKFDEYISMYTTIAQRNNQPFYLILLDIDHFKKINDTYGHDIGDQVLVDFSKMVTQLIRKSDIFCRYGGEEFALIVSNNESLDGPVLAEKIRQNMESNEFSEKAIKLTISCGVASFEANDTVSTLIRCADEALYKAKRAGRNRVEVNPPIECDEQRFPT